MSRRPIIVAAAITGVVVAGGVAVAREAQPVARTATSPGTTGTTTTPAPTTLVRLVPGLAMPLDGWAKDHRAIAGTDRISVTVADPVGGPDWAVRQFKRRREDGKGRVWCAQLGRIVDGEFAWFTPGSATARRLPLAETELTTCATATPAEENLGLRVAGMPTLRIQDPASRIGATIAWGVVNRPVASARIENPVIGGPVEVHGRVLLRVVRGPAAPSWSRLIVQDRGGGTRTAASSWAINYGASAGFSVRTPPKDVPVVASPEFRLAARAEADDDGPPRGIFTRAGGKRPCATTALPVVGDQAVAEFGAFSGLVQQLPLGCERIPASADWIPTVIGGNWSVGDSRREGGTIRGIASARRRTEERLATDSGSVSVATPVGTRFLEVRSPVGVKVVRVPESRITTISWRGQPEVRRALWGQERRGPGNRLVIRGPVVSFQALDGRGHAIGELGWSSRGLLAIAKRKHAAKIKRERRAARERAARQALGAPAPTTGGGTP